MFRTMVLAGAAGSGTGDARGGGDGSARAQPPFEPGLGEAEDPSPAVDEAAGPASALGSGPRVEDGLADPAQLARLSTIEPTSARSGHLRGNLPGSARENTGGV